MTAMPFLDLSALRPGEEIREANRNRRVHFPHDECVLCARPMSESALDRAQYVRVVQGGASLAPVDLENIPEASDLGFQPIGPECAKRVPANYRRRLD